MMHTGAQEGRAGRRRHIPVVLALSVAMVCSACTGGPLGGKQAASTPAGSSSDAATPPPGREKLTKFYKQSVQWEDCDNAKCGWLTVPVDYEKPDGETLKLRMLRVPAQGEAKGALFVNPGGPGASATDYAKLATYIVSPHVRQSYDVVGVDPRGVGKSNPIVCLDDQQADEMFAFDPTPDDPAENAQAETIAKQFGQACQSKYPNLLPHLSTNNVVKDMDIARAALGQRQMTYMGKSYGTFIGALYAEQFPKQVGRFVLDGAIAPDLTEKELTFGQAEGFETATRAYVADCVKKGSCPLGGSVDEGMQSLRDMLKRLDSQPVPVKGDERVKQLTEGWASIGLASAMYAEQKWPELTKALRGIKAGDGTDMFTLASGYVDRDKSGRYTGNLMQVISAVNCLDHPAEKQTKEQREARIAEAKKIAPTWGAYMAGTSYTCANWPAPADGKPRKIAAEGANPIMVVGTTRDPATPYAWSERLAKQLKSSRLVTYDGDGHTAYMRSNRCVHQAVDDYFLHGKVPDHDVKC